MSFIDTTYFGAGDITIPTADNGDLTQAIEQYEKEILIDALGYELYSLLIDDLDEGGEPQTQRFIDLVDGAEFNLDYCGKTFLTKWEGLRNSYKQSFIAYYTYFNYVSRTNEHLSSIGNAMFETETGERSSPVLKMVSAWSKMMALYGLINPNDLKSYGLFNCFDFNGCEVFETPSIILTPEPSLYNFLATNVDTYPEWMFKPKKSINQFGI